MKEGKFTPQLIATNHESESGFDNAARHKLKVLKNLESFALQYIEIEDTLKWKKNPMTYFISQLDNLRIKNNLPHYWSQLQLTEYLNIDLTFFKINCKIYQDIRIPFDAKGEIIKPSFEIYTTNERQNRILEDIKTICSILNEFPTKHNLDVTFYPRQLGKNISEFTTDYNGAFIPNQSRILQIK
jgi:hypothetical protein